MQILTDRQIRQKIRRIAIEIVERNFDESELVFAGINNNGFGFAKILMEEVQKFSNKSLSLTYIKLNPAQPLDGNIAIGTPADMLKDKAIIVVDDVANTGRTIFYAFKPLLGILPKKIETAVLVDRKHKFFPVQIDYYGLSLATTLKENIKVKICDTEEYAVFLN